MTATIYMESHLRQPVKGCTNESHSWPVQPAVHLYTPLLQRVGCQKRVISKRSAYRNPARQDLGATCTDSVEGNIADMLVLGLPLSTAAATPPGAPATVLYGCADAFGFAAAPVVRRVTVYDKCQEQGEATCPSTGECSLAGEAGGKGLTKL